MFLDISKKSEKIIYAMRKIFIFVSFGLFLAACGTKNPKPTLNAEQLPKAKTEVDLLVDFLARSGDYVNSRQFPSMIKAETVYAGLDSSMYVIDLRDAEQFNKGHIKGAANVQFSDIPAYFENRIKPYEYDKIIMVCGHGQRSSYTTHLLRLMGYGNVYSMRWGMAAWNPALAGDGPWSGLISSDYSSKLETKENLTPPAGEYPSLMTGKTTGEEIFKARINEVFAEGLKEFAVSAAEVFASPDSFYIINYERKDKYDYGHVPGAVRYKPGATLGIEAEMKTIPADKDVVVYCATGHNSAFVVAYLRLLGYKAHSMRYGNNSFMHDKMVQEKTRLSWEAFSDGIVKDFPFSTD
jgi:rhodanese-related sulfurtransferase